MPMRDLRCDPFAGRTVEETLIRGPATGSCRCSDRATFDISRLACPCKDQRLDPLKTGLAWFELQT